MAEAELGVTLSVIGDDQAEDDVMRDGTRRAERIDEISVAPPDGPESAAGGAGWGPEGSDLIATVNYHSRHLIS